MAGRSGSSPPEWEKCADTQNEVGADDLARPFVLEQDSKFREIRCYSRFKTGLPSNARRKILLPKAKLWSLVLGRNLVKLSSPQSTNHHRTCSIT